MEEITGWSKRVIVADVKCERPIERKLRSRLILISSRKLLHLHFLFFLLLFPYYTSCVSSLVFHWCIATKFNFAVSGCKIRSGSYESGDSLV